MRRALPLLVVLLSLAGARAASAQGLCQTGFVAGGRGGSDSRLLSPSYTVAAGYGTSTGCGGGVELGVRTSGSLSRFSPDLRAHLDSAGASSGRIDGGRVTVTDIGADVLAGVRRGRIGVHAFAGLHWYGERAKEKLLRTDQGELAFRSRVRSALGPAYGGGVSFWLIPTGGVSAEWFRGGGGEEGMMEMEGVRFGLVWAM